MGKLEKAKEIIEANIKNAKYGIFNTRNLVWDVMDTIYHKDGLTVDICYGWEYFEVFGLSDDEFNELKRFYYERS